MLSIRSLTRLSLQSLFSALIVCGSGQSAHAEGGEYRTRVPLLPQYQTECSACHVAYPPGLLPAASWQRIMGHLSKHFGTDASLDDANTKDIGAWLASHAGRGKRAASEPPEDRITRSLWFVREHDELPGATFKRAAIKSASHCAACHTGANQGDFSEHNIRIPK